MAAHLDLAIEDNLRRGLLMEEARRQALVRFGGAERRELTRWSPSVLIRRTTPSSRTGRRPETA
jgi:hypothetical protein